MTNYEKGANFERKCKKWLEGMGYFVIRSAGSHSPVDLVVMNRGEIMVVQCKIDGLITKKERVEIERIKQIINCKVLMAKPNKRGSCPFTLVEL